MDDTVYVVYTSYVYQSWLTLLICGARDIGLEFGISKFPRSLEYGLWGSIQHALSTTASATNAIFSLLQNLSADLSQRLATVIWSILKHRNLRVWEDVIETSDLVVERARKMVVDWQLATAPDAIVSTDPSSSSLTLNGGPSTSTLHNGSRWQHPMPGRYKCNIDVAFSNSLNRTCIGIYIRESDGSFVLAKTVLHPCFLPVDVGEALGLYLALQWLSDMQFDNVDFETNSKLTADAFLSDKNNTCEFGCIITYCRSLFNSLFSNSMVEFVRRQANGVAYALARDVTLLTSLAVYYDILISSVKNKMLK
ncbi:uncharacterized protein [Medicago truncatula]|uniref:uncharacterized protein n=1 Tax=Medicago truncatula TaxID=3880 RepID=UPI000D2F361B|nr:uncharacterized protein LOC112420239 [Medicago truncatula]